METENPRIAGGLGPAAESNEHDYAHTSDPPEPGLSGSVQPPEPPQLELPEPALGAEVDCPGGTEQEAGSAEESVVTRGSPRWSKRPEDRNCCCCRILFLRQGRSFNRRSVYTFTTPETVRWVFPDSLVHEKSFLCETCVQIIKTRAKRTQSGKRVMFVKPPETRKVKEPGRRMGKKTKAALLISRSSYRAAFRMLWSSKGARKPMIEFWSKQLRNEMKLLSRKQGSPFHQKVSSRKPLSSFPWRRCLSWAQENAPLVTACLSSMFPDIKTLFKRSHNQLTEEQAVTLLERRTVVALSIPLFTRNIWTNNFLQAAVGELRLQGYTGAALDLLNSMGLCQNKDTARLLVHRLQNGADMGGEQRLMLKHQQMKEDMGQTTTDEEEEEEEEEEDDDDDDEDDEEEEENKQEDEMMPVELEVEVEEVQDGLKVEESDLAVMEKEERRRRKKAKKQRKVEKRKQRRGKRKEREEEEEKDKDDELEQKRKVVVVRLGLLKGTSEVGRSDLSAP